MDCQTSRSGEENEMIEYALVLIFLVGSIISAIITGRVFTGVNEIDRSISPRAFYLMLSFLGRVSGLSDCDDDYILRFVTAKSQFHFVFQFAAMGSILS
jgi:hypothetical protein